jgi:GNAT superfamily N-acetyltransferase
MMKIVMEFIIVKKLSNMDQEMKITIRKAQPKDFNDLRKMLRDADLVLLGNDWSDQDFKNHSGKRGILQVAELDNKVVGFILGEELTGTWVIIHEMVVAKEHRGSRVFFELIKWFDDWLKSNGKTHTLIYADARDARLQKIYERFGFKSNGPVIEMIREN